MDTGPPLDRGLSFSTPRNPFLLRFSGIRVRDSSLGLPLAAHPRTIVVPMGAQTHDAGLERADCSVQGRVLDIDRFASHDGPGIRTAVFLKGCPLACIWCHSPESQYAAPQLLFQSRRCVGCWSCIDVCPHGALLRGRTAERAVAVLQRDRCTECGECAKACYPGALSMSGRIVTVGDVVDEIARDRAFFDSSGGGVTVSGGEPTAQPAFTFNLLAACRERALHTALQTTGHARWEIVARLASVAKLVLYDVKLMDAALHQRYTGVSNTLILGNLRRLMTVHHDVLVRVPCIPGINDAPDQIGEIARALAGIGVRTIELMRYNAAAGAKYHWLGRSFALAERGTQSDEHMERLARIVGAHGIAVAAA